MITRVTEHPNYKRCRRKWHLGSSNRMNLTRIGLSPVFGLGHAVHEALAKWMLYDRDQKAGTLHAPIEHHAQEGVCVTCGVKEKDHYTYVEGQTYRLSDEYMRVCARMVSEAQAACRERNGTEMSDAELGPFMDVVMLGRAMMENYQDYHGTPLPPDFTLIAPEQDIIVDIPGTEHTEEWLYNAEVGVVELVKYDTPRCHKLGARLDAIIRDGSGRYYAPDHKTYSQRPKEEVIRYSDQFTAYTWVLRQLGLGDVGGVAYDGMWKREKPPKGSQMSDLFTRVLIRPSLAELAEFEEMLAWEAIEMASNPPITKDRRWDGSCQWGCEFDPLCRAMMHGEDTKFVIKSMYVPRDTVVVADKDE